VASARHFWRHYTLPSSGPRNRAGLRSDRSVPCKQTLFLTPVAVIPLVPLSFKEHVRVCSAGGEAGGAGVPEVNGAMMSNKMSANSSGTSPGGSGPSSGRAGSRAQSGSAAQTPPVLGGGTQFLTVAEVANLMRVSKMTVYRLVHSGELPAVRVGRSFRVHAKAVHDYLETSYFDAG
jgi:excisionase family DNA binding protein